MPFKHKGHSKDLTGKADERMDKALSSDYDQSRRENPEEKAGPFTKQQQKDYTDRRGDQKGGW